MPDVLVTCITNPDRTSLHEHITNLGGQGMGLVRSKGDNLHS